MNVNVKRISTQHIHPRYQLTTNHRLVDAVESCAMDSAGSANWKAWWPFV